MLPSIAIVKLFETNPDILQIYLEPTEASEQRTLEKIAGLIGSRKQSIRAISAQFCYDAGRHLLLQTPNFPTVQCISAEFSN